MVARDVVLVAQDDGQRLVAHAVTGKQHALVLAALGALAAAHEVDRVAQRLEGVVGQNAGEAHRAQGVLANLAHDMPQVERLRAATQVAGIELESRAIAHEVAAEARGGELRREHVLLHVHARALLRHQAHVVEHLGGVARHHGEEVELGVLLHRDAHAPAARGAERLRGRRVAHKHDRGLGAGAHDDVEHEGGAGDLGHVHDDGLIGHLACGHLHTAHLAGRSLEPGLGLCACTAHRRLAGRALEAALDDLGGPFGDRHLDVDAVDLQMVPGGSGKLVHLLKYLHVCRLHASPQRLPSRA